MDGPANHYSEGKPEMMMSATMVEQADPLFDRIATAALAQGFDEGGVSLSEKDGWFMVRLEKAGVFSERWMLREMLEEAVGRPEVYEVQQIDNRIAEFIRREEGIET